MLKLLLKLISFNYFPITLNSDNPFLLPPAVFEISLPHIFAVKNPNQLLRVSRRHGGNFSGKTSVHSSLNKVANTIPVANKELLLNVAITKLSVLGFQRD